MVVEAIRRWAEGRGRVARTNPLVLLGFIGVNDADLMPQFLAWYRRLGVTSFRLILHGDWPTAARAVLDAPDIAIVREIGGPFSETRKVAELTAEALKHKRQWCIVVDADEFIEFPLASVAEVIAEMEAMGIDDLYALLVQRVAADGSLAAVDPRGTVEAQFPLASVTLADQMGLEVPIWKSKYPLTRVGPTFSIKRGNHLPPNGRSVAHLPLRAVLHHFKWRDRLVHAFAAPRGPLSNQAEMDAYSQWLGENGNLLPVAHARPASRQMLVERGWLVAPDAGARGIAAELAAARTRLLTRQPRVAFVTFEISEARHGGGIATAMSALAKLLASHGFSVEIIYCPWRNDERLNRIWHDYWASFGVRLTFCPVRPKEARSSFRQRLMRTVDELGPLDVLHVHEVQGYAAWFLEQRLLEKRHPAPVIVLTLHGGTQWHNELNGTPWLVHEAERESEAIRMADLAISPSRYMLDWYAQNGAVPRVASVVANPLSPEGKNFGASSVAKAMPQAVAFFGRLERRKGIELFIGALRLLAEQHALRPKVLFLGGFGLGYARPDLDRAMKGLGLDYEVLSTLDPQNAIEVLREREAVAVVPSLRENAPYVVYECAEARIPLVTTAPGGAPDMLDEPTRASAIVAANAEAIATRLAGVLTEGVVPARLAFSALAVDLQHVRLWEGLVAHRAPVPAEPARVVRVETPLATDAQRARNGGLICVAPATCPVDAATLDALGQLLIESGADLLVANARIEADGADTLGLIEAERPDWPASFSGLPVIGRAETLRRLSRDLPQGDDPAVALLQAALELKKSILCPAVPQLSIPARRPAASAQASPQGLAAKAQPSVPERGGTLIDGPYPLGENDVLRGLVLSNRPYATLSMFTPACPFGAIPLSPRRDRSVHFIHHDYSLAGRAEDLRKRLDEIKSLWPLARTVMLAADPAELQDLRSAGLDAMLGNINMFVDETIYAPGMDMPPGERALYVAPPVAGKRHDLASCVEALDLVFLTYPGMPDRSTDIRAGLAAARIINQNAAGDGYDHLSEEEMARAIASASVGLFLSAEDGSCPESLMFLLSGVPVVSVPNRGGRGLFLDAPLAIEAAATPEGVADAIDRLRGMGLTRAAIRGQALDRLHAMRGRFESDAGDIWRHWLGDAMPPLDWPSLKPALRYRRFGFAFPGAASRLADLNTTARTESDSTT